MGSSRSLKTYRSMRDFRRSPEPAGKPGGKSRWKAGENPIFVIQQHDARAMHYDVRLEVDGVLASWAVPKGPSTDPREKRLAVRTEDHPLAYADFEGVIPPGAYGAGSVIVWDAGPYRNLREAKRGDGASMAKSIEDGLVEVWLEGRKVRGGWALVHAKLGGEEKNWLLVKLQDEEADARRKPTQTEPGSVLTGRTVQEVAEQAEEDAGEEDA